MMKMSKLESRLFLMKNELNMMLDDDLSDAMDEMAAELADEFWVDVDQARAMLRE